MLRGLAALCLVGCTAGSELDPVLESEHFQVHGDGPICPEITGWLEHYAHTFEATFAVSSPVIDYRLHRDTASLAESGCDSLGCAGAGAVDSVFPVHAHELVHVFAEQRGRPPHIFSEGLAEVFGCQPEEAAASIAIDRALVDEILSSGGFDAATRRGEPTYALAASLVRHLLDRFGDRAFFELYAETGHDFSRGQIADAFEARLGVDLDAELDRWAASPPSRICRRDVECSMFDLPPGVAVGARMMCGRLGSPAELTMTLEVDEPGPVSIEIAGDRLRGASIASCRGGPSRPVDGGVIDLEAGRHWLLVRGAEAGDRATIRW